MRASRSTLAIEVGNRLPLDLACLQRLDRAGEFLAYPRSARGTQGKHVHLCPADDEPEVLEEPADLVLEISLILTSSARLTKALIA